MRIAYLDCSTGIAGDMTLAALVDSGVDGDAISAAVASLDLPGVSLEFPTVQRGGFRCRQAVVSHPEQHAHRHLSDILELVERADGLSAAQKAKASELFAAIGRAEARVHGMPLDSVHFHEVGAVDSIVDIVGAAVGFDLLAADEVVCSRLPTGRGQITIDHGVCTLPAPATARLLVGIPLVDVPLEAELTTPTGAAIASVFADRFGPLPEMTLESIGLGAGTTSFPDRANALRILVGTATPVATLGGRDTVTLLETNLDDVPGEVVGHAKRLLLDAGALDVFSTPVQMKKDRPGIVLTVLARPAEADRLETILFDETETLGVRRQTIVRSVRGRETTTVDTVYGPVSGKTSRRSGVDVFTPEFEDCARLAAERGLPVRQVYRAAEAATAWASVPGTSGEPAPRDDSHGHDHDHDHSHDHDHGHSHDHPH